MQVGEPLNGIGEGLLVDLGVLGADAVADGRISEPSSAVRYASISMRIQSTLEQAGIFFAKLRRECLECDLGIFGDDR
jgi:hypothetical protein